MSKVFYLSFLIYKSAVPQRSSSPSVGESVKLLHTATSSWYRSNFGKPFAKVTPRVLKRVFKVLWTNYNLSKRPRVHTWSGHTGHLTVSRGPMVRKKQSREQLGWSNSGLWLHLNGFKMFQRLDQRALFFCVKFQTQLLHLCNSTSLTSVFSSSIMPALVVVRRLQSASPVFFYTL